MEESICNTYARKGDLFMVQYYYRCGEPIDESTCAAAAESGNLDILKWLRGGWLYSFLGASCPWDERTILLAKNDDIIQYARERGCPPYENRLKNNPLILWIQEHFHPE